MDGISATIQQSPVTDDNHLHSSTVKAETCALFSIWTVNCNDSKAQSLFMFALDFKCQDKSTDQINKIYKSECLYKGKLYSTFSNLDKAVPTELQGNVVGKLIYGLKLKLDSGTIRRWGDWSLPT